MLKWLPLDWRRKKQTLTEKKILKGEAKKSESNMTVTRWSNWSEARWDKQTNKRPAHMAQSPHLPFDDDGDGDDYGGIGGDGDGERWWYFQTELGFRQVS